ncbi:MAG: hypothetical protein IJN90_02980 [Bacilli bacterium]|nr:hypothetical protein [Bacilli bacterium]
MKKNKLLILIICLISFLPCLTNASECSSTPSYSGVAESGYAAAGGKTNCNPPCYTNRFAGLRFRIYSYKDGNLKPLGNGVDIWSKKATEVITSSGRYSSPNTDFLNKRINNSCTNNGKFTKWSTSFSLNASQYKQMKVFYDSELGSANAKLGQYDFGGFILKYNDKGEPNDGWLYDNLYSKIMNRSTANDEFIKNLWGIEANSLVAQGEDIYIGVEILQRVDTSSYGNSNYGISTYKLYYGSPSDFAPIYGTAEAYVSLYNSTSKTPVGKLATTGNLKGTYKIKIKNPMNTNAGCWGNSCSTYNQYAGTVFGFLGGNTGLYNATYAAACNNTIGMAVFHFAECEKCVNSCDNECGKYSDGTTERRACAMKYCKENPVKGESYDSCIAACSPGPSKDEGCDPSEKCDPNKLVTNYKGDKVCDEKDDMNQKCDVDTTITSKVCYDDNTNISIPGEVISDSTAKDLEIIYYRINCDEKLKVFNGSNGTKVLQFENRVADLHIGLSTTFEKNCTLQFKERYMESGTYKYKWENAKGKDKDTSALIMEDIKTYEDYRDKTKDVDLYNEYDKIIKKLNNTYNRAYNRLSYVTELDTTKVDATTKVEIVNESLTDSKTINIKLKPIFCEMGDSKVGSASMTNLKCVLKEDKIYLQEDNSVICGNDGAADIKINNTTGGTGNYKYTVYYGTESTWNSSYGDLDDVYVSDATESGREKCLTAVEIFNGYCTEIEDVYRFKPFTAGINTSTTITKTTGKYDIYISGYGSCGQIKFGCCADYKIEDGNKCNKCMDYDPTSQEYLDCYKAYCSCDVICGANVACRAKYCPLECEGCEVGYTDITSTDDSCDTCVEKCNTDFSPAGGGGTNKNLSSNIVCRYDCCNASCDIGNDTCRFDCCITKCNSLQEKNLLEYMGYKTTASMTALEACYQDCRCPNGNCGNDYYYRTINQEKPFPDRTPGANWYNKVEHITESENVNGKYYDPTNGKNSGYEYKISLSSEDIQKIKNDKKINTTYTQKMSSEDKANLDDRGVYCSYLLHDYLNNELNIRIEEGSDGKYGSGCANIG